jgi:hypothetical protein
MGKSDILILALVNPVNKGTGPSTSAQTPKGDNVEDALSDRSTQCEFFFLTLRFCVMTVSLLVCHTAESLPRPAFSTKDFPRPYQPPSSITRGSDMAKGHAVVLRYVRGLVGITGVVTKSSRDLYDEPTAPTGLGESVDVYLNAHGYDADAKLHIMYAWRENSGIADFVSYLCGKGMVVSEVKWLWRLITENF